MILRRSISIVILTTLSVVSLLLLLLTALSYPMRTTGLPALGLTETWARHEMLQDQNLPSMTKTLGIFYDINCSDENRLFIHLYRGYVSVAYHSRLDKNYDLVRRNVYIRGVRLKRYEFSGRDSRFGPGVYYARVLSIRSPLWIPFLAFSMAPLIALARLSLKRRWNPVHCGSCDYNLTGNISGICPECGTPIADEVKAALKQMKELAVPERDQNVGRPPSSFGGGCY